ncbi:hypothetical protein NW762_011732 [Fusarium torreyae]|uniref:Uncharacterized protein n=1 Tax=Fusarium torreyae TaxID=1237075 RepID=A0A9W8RT06_9HYPO|nr:hypothetical protein NW762_011732 [Fusarium torreyae]
MSLALPTPDATNTRHKASNSKRETARSKKLLPGEYANAVLGYSRLPTGAGQNHIALGQYLSNDSDSSSIRFEPGEDDDEYVTLYPLGNEPVIHRSSSQSPAGSSNEDGDETSEDRRHRALVPVKFQDPSDFYAYNLNKPPQSCIIFLRGFMTARWINNIGARYFVDPELFCRHLDFSPRHDNASNFSIPALPSSSGHLIELPIITIGKRTAPTDGSSADKINELRSLGANALAEHYHQVSKLGASKLKLGESMIRDYHVFDETHFAIEQRVSICMQQPKKDNDASQTFTLLAWLDAGTDFPRLDPWAVYRSGPYHLPVIRHKPMVALKCHLFANRSPDGADSNTGQIQSLSSLPHGYGRSLRSSIMAKDPFYTIIEIFDFAASSQIQFLNLIDAKLYSYTSGPASKEFESLGHLKYIKAILNSHLQKTKRVLDSIKNAQLSTWPKDDSNSARTSNAAHNVEQDFQHILDRTVSLNTRVSEAISVLMSSMSISESQRAIIQAQRVGKLTFLAFIFVPLSFTTSFFGMNVAQLENGNLGIWWWFVMSVPIVALVFALYFVDVSNLWDKLRGT